MTRRQARRKLGSRTSRRVGTKTRIIPGGSQKKAPKYRTRAASKGKPSLAARVRAILKAAQR